MIRPTVGRVVLFYKYVNGQGHKGPMAAHVAFVHSDSMVNLMVISENGLPSGFTSVELIQDDVNEPVPSSDYCTWMPYQKAVASGAQAPTLHA